MSSPDQFSSQPLNNASAPASYPPSSSQSSTETQPVASYPPEPDRRFVSQLSPNHSKPTNDGIPASKPDKMVDVCVYDQSQKSQDSVSRQPCDVMELVIADRHTSQFLRAASHLRYQPLSKSVPLHLRPDLTQYDIVLERVINYLYINKNDSLPGYLINKIYTELFEKSIKKIEIKKKLIMFARAKYLGTCAPSTHPLIEITPISSVWCEPLQKKSWKKTETEEFTIIGWPISGGIDGYLLKKYWIFGGKLQEWSIQAYGCAIRDSGSPLGMLTGLVRAYSCDEYTLTFTYPSVFNYSAERSKSIDVKWQSKRTEAISSKQFGQVVTSSTEETTNKKDGSSEFSSAEAIMEDGKLHKSEMKQAVDKNGKVTSAEVEGSVEKRSSGKLVLSRQTDSRKTVLAIDSDGVLQPKYEKNNKKEIEVRPAFTLIKNGEVIDFSNYLNKILNLIKSIKKAIENIKEIVPAVGWKATFDLKVLEGTIRGKWGVQNEEDIEEETRKELCYSYRSDRYIAVRKYYSLEFDLIVFGASLTLMAGLEVKVDAVFWTVAEITVKVEGTLAGQTSLNWKVGNDFDTPAPKLGAELTGELSGVCRANAVGIHLVDAAAKLKGGLKFTGVPQVSFKKAPSIDSKLVRLETAVTYKGSLGKEAQTEVKVPLYDEMQLWTGDLLDLSN